MRLMSKKSLNGMVISESRRHYLLDSICIVAGLVDRFGIRGKILDVGCLIGMLPHSIARLYSNDVFGMDSCRPAIATAISLCKRLQNLSFEVGGLPSISSEKFDVVVCIDVLHHLDEDQLEKSLKNLSTFVAENCLLVVRTNLISDEANLKQFIEVFDELGLGLVVSDVIGGSDRFPPEFRAEVVFVMSTSSSNSLPPSLVEDSQKWWVSHFTDYADDPETSTREKTQAFERARRQLNDIV